MKLTKSFIQKTKSLQTPFLMVDLDQIRKNYQKMKKSFKGINIFYAMKANDNLKIIETLRDEGSSFEISSLAELETLLTLKIPPKKIMCFNSFKNPEFLKRMAKEGVSIMAYDSYDEVDKIAKYAPNSQLVLRIVVDNKGSDWPLTKKFGVEPNEAISFLEYAKKKKLQPIGVTFHVGSQCLNINNWINALLVCKKIWKEASEKGINLSLLSLGGGLPIKHLKEIPRIDEISKSINKMISKNFQPLSSKLTVTIEPGRGLVGDCGIMGTTVVGKAKRGTENWAYIDVGIFNGLMETVENFQYELETEKNGKRKVMTTVGGPSCDSVDIPFKNIRISNVKIGDRIFIINSCAYTTVYAAKFNGFDVPKIYFSKNNSQE